MVWQRSMITRDFYRIQIISLRVKRRARLEIEELASRKNREIDKKCVYRKREIRSNY